MTRNVETRVYRLQSDISCTSNHTPAQETYKGYMEGEGTVVQPAPLWMCDAKNHKMIYVTSLYNGSISIKDQPEACCQL